jgi:hypothetical protein
MSLHIPGTINKEDIKPLKVCAAKFKFSEDFYSSYSNEYFIAKGDILKVLGYQAVGEDWCVIFTSYQHKIKKDVQVVFYMRNDIFEDFTDTIEDIPNEITNCSNTIK